MRALSRWINLFISFIAVASLLYINHLGLSRRSYPSEKNVRFYRVSTERDAYSVYKLLNLGGATVVHLNNALNISEYYPEEETDPVGYPIPVRDVIPLYEKGITSGNWLFIATRSGMVRKVYNLVPDTVFNLFEDRFRDRFEYSVTDGRIAGYVRDTEHTVSTLTALPEIEEPVVLDIDAGFFIAGDPPERILSELWKRCRDIRAVVLIDSSDRGYVTEDMRRSLDSIAAEVRILR